MRRCCRHVRKLPFLAPSSSKNDPFAKTGSGQTRGNAEKELSAGGGGHVGAAAASSFNATVRDLIDNQATNVYRIGCGLREDGQKQQQQHTPTSMRLSQQPVAAAAAAAASDAAAALIADGVRAQTSCKFFTASLVIVLRNSCDCQRQALRTKRKQFNHQKAK
jgi:hypothetical protein